MKTKLYLLPIALCLCATGTACRAITLSFDPTSLTVPVGQEFSMDLRATVSATEAFRAFDIDVLYDGSLMTWIGTTVPSVLTLQPDPSATRLIALVQTGEPDFFGSDVLLATLVFRCDGPGFSSIDTGSSSLLQGFLVNPPGQTFPTWIQQWTSEPASVMQTSAIPDHDSGTVFLLVSSFVLLLAARSPRKTRCRARV